MLKKFMERWKEMLFIAAVVGVVWQGYTVKNDAEAASKKANDNNAAIAQLAILAAKIDSNLDMLLKMGAISKDTFEELRMVPTQPYDENGNPQEEWYLVGEDAIYLIKSPPGCVTIQKIPIGEP